MRQANAIKCKRSANAGTLVKRNPQAKRHLGFGVENRRSLLGPGEEIVLQALNEFLVESRFSF